MGGGGGHTIYHVSNLKIEARLDKAIEQCMELGNHRLMLAKEGGGGVVATS